LSPPVTRELPVTFARHGTSYVDPFVWLESPSDAREAWLAEQQRWLEAHLDRDVVGDLRAQFERLSRYRSLGVPVRRGGVLFRAERSPGADQAVLLVDDGHGERRLVDPARVGASATLDWWYPSGDGRRLAYGISVGGDEWSTLHVIDVSPSASSARDVGEAGPFLVTIPRTRAASVAWDPDGGGFLYTRYPAEADVPPGEAAYGRRVFHHRLGDDPATDPMVFADNDPRAWTSVQRRGRWVVITVHRGWTRVDVWVAAWDGVDVVTLGAFRPLIVGIDAAGFGEIVGDSLFWATDLEAPRRRLIEIPLDNPAGLSAARTVIAESAQGTLDGFAVLRGGILASVLVDAASTLVWVDAASGEAAVVALPELGTVAAIGGDPEDASAFVSFSSYQRPTTLFEVTEAGARVWAAPTLPFDPSQLVTEREWFASRDGTRVSMFVVRHRATVLDGRRPAVLSGYGGFAISRTPAFSMSIVPFLEAGGVYAVAQLRGGGEYGQAWHRAGMLANKQTTFDDVIAARRALSDRCDRVAIMGGSNGGLLVGAAVTQAPELWSGAVCMVPLLDMHRYHEFLLAKLWIPEYGDPDDPVQFQWLAGYSPYQKVRDDLVYPPMLLTTGDGDSRVHPMHALKMAARLQACRGGPALLRYERGAGHGVGKGRGAVVDELADIWAFLWRTLGVATT
jgi:prolyl oligopeptidase